MASKQLIDEIKNDPENRGYSTMTDEEVEADLRLPRFDVPRSSMSGSEVLNAIVPADFISLTQDKKQQVWDVVHIVTAQPR